MCKGDGEFVYHLLLQYPVVRDLLSLVFSIFGVAWWFFEIVEGVFGKAWEAWGWRKEGYVIAFDCGVFGWSLGDNLQAFLIWDATVCALYRGFFRSVFDSLAGVDFPYSTFFLDFFFNFFIFFTVYVGTC